MAMQQAAIRGRPAHSAPAPHQSRTPTLASGAPTAQPRAASGPRAGYGPGGAAQPQAYQPQGVRQLGAQPGHQYAHTQGHAFQPDSRPQGAQYSPGSLSHNSPPPRVQSNMQQFNALGGSAAGFYGSGCKVSSPASSVATTATRSSTPARMDGGSNPLSSGRRPTDPLSRPEPLSRQLAQTPDASRQTPGSQASPANLMSRYDHNMHTPPGNAPSGTNLSGSRDENLTKGSSLLSGSTSGRGNMERVQWTPPGQAKSTPEGPSPASQLRLDPSAARDGASNARENLARNGSSTNREEAKTPPDNRMMYNSSFCTERGLQGQRTRSAVRSPHARPGQAAPGVSPPKVVNSSVDQGCVSDDLMGLLQKCDARRPDQVPVQGDERLNAPTIRGRDLTEPGVNPAPGLLSGEDKQHSWFCSKLPDIRAASVYWLHKHICPGTCTVGPLREEVRKTVDNVMRQCQYHEVHLVIALKYLMRYQEKRGDSDDDGWRGNWHRNLHVALHMAESWHPFEKDSPLKGKNVVQQASGLLGAPGDKQLWDAEWEMCKTLEWKLMVTQETFKEFVEEMHSDQLQQQVRNTCTTRGAGGRGHQSNLMGTSSGVKNRSAPPGGGHIHSKSSPSIEGKRPEMLSPKRETDDQKKGGEQEPHIESALTSGKNGDPLASVPHGKSLGAMPAAATQPQPPRGGPGQTSKIQSRVTVGNPSGVGDSRRGVGIGERNSGLEAVRQVMAAKQPQLPLNGQDRGRTGIDSKTDGPRPAASDRLTDSRPFASSRTEAPPPVSSRLGAPLNYGGEANRGSNGISGTNTARAVGGSVPLRTTATPGSAATGSQRRELSGPAGTSAIGMPRTATSHTPRHQNQLGLKPSPSGPGSTPPQQNPTMNMFPNSPQRCNVGTRGANQGALGFRGAVR